MGSQVSSDVCRSFLALHSSHCLEPQVRHVRSFLYTLPPLADEDTKDGRDLLQRHCPTLSWQSSAYSLPCWGCLLRSWGAELLPLLETLHGSWGQRNPSPFITKPKSGWEIIRAGVPLEGPTSRAVFVLHGAACSGGEETGVGWGANTPSPTGQGVCLLAWCLLVSPLSFCHWTEAEDCARLMRYSSLFQKVAILSPSH